MNLILARHGNTFAPGQPSVWAGAKDDLVLVESGRQQASTLASGLTEATFIPSTIYCGPLKRTREYASIVAQTLKLSTAPIVEPRLNEIDYGQWSGLSNEQVIAKFGEEALHDWTTKCIWPANGEWRRSPLVIQSEIVSLVDELKLKHSASENILLVTSNGRLRYFLSIVPNEFEKHVQSQSFKVATGNVCVMSLVGDRFELRAWNAAPEQLTTCRA